VLGGNGVDRCSTTLATTSHLPRTAPRKLID